MGQMNYFFHVAFMQSSYFGGFNVGMDLFRVYLITVT